MKFFNFLRRVNRGIILAIILVIGLICYLTVDSLAFNGEREVITKRLEDYTADMSEFLLLPEQYREIGTDVPESVIKNKISENTELIKKYFTDSNYYGFNMRESVTLSVESSLKRNNDTGNKIKSSEATLKNVKKIIKHGANLVTVEAVINITTASTDQAETIQFFHTGNNFSYEKIPGEQTDLSFTTRNQTITFECEMTKQNGIWVFSDYGYMSY